MRRRLMLVVCSVLCSVVVSVPPCNAGQVRPETRKCVEELIHVASTERSATVLYSHLNGEMIFERVLGRSQANVSRSDVRSAVIRLIREQQPRLAAFVKRSHVYRSETDGRDARHVKATMINGAEKDDITLTLSKTACTMINLSYIGYSVIGILKTHFHIH